MLKVGCVNARCVNQTPLMSDMVLQDDKSQKLHKQYSCYQTYYQREQWRTSHLSHDLI